MFWGLIFPVWDSFIAFNKRLALAEVIDVNGLNPFNFKSITIEDRDELPEESGIYFVIDNSNIYYIGMSKNLQQRWYSHHKQAALDSFTNLRIAYLDCLPKHYLKNIESTLIKHFKPRLNIRENPLYKKG